MSYDHKGFDKTEKRGMIYIVIVRLLRIVRWIVIRV